MKKIIALCVCVALCFALVGCGGETTQESLDSNIVSNTETSEISVQSSQDSDSSSTTLNFDDWEEYMYYLFDDPSITIEKIVVDDTSEGGYCSVMFSNIDDLERFMIAAFAAALTVGVDVYDLPPISTLDLRSNDFVLLANRFDASSTGVVTMLSLLDGANNADAIQNKYNEHFYITDFDAMFK